MSAWVPEMSQEDGDDLALFQSVYVDVDLTTLLVLVENTRHRAWAEAAARYDQTVEPEDKPFDPAQADELIERVRQLVARFAGDDERLVYAIAVMVAAEVWKASR